MVPQGHSSPPIAAYMPQWIGSALVQIMFVAYSTPSHHLNPSRVIVNCTLSNKLQWKFSQNTKLFIHEIASECVISKKAAILFGLRWVKGPTIQNAPVYLHGSCSLNPERNVIFFTCVAHWGLKNGWHFADYLFKNIVWKKRIAFLFWFYWSLFQRPVDNMPSLVHVRDWCQMGDKPLPEQMMTQFTGTHMLQQCPSHYDVIKWKHFRVTGPLCAEFTGDRWILLRKASDTELWCFLWSIPEQTLE